MEFNIKYDQFRLTWAFIISIIGALGMLLALFSKIEWLFLPCMFPMLLGLWSVSFHTAKAKFILNNQKGIMENPGNYFLHLLFLSKIAEWTFTGSLAGLIFMIGCWVYNGL
jgi:hypothetical protein